MFSIVAYLVEWSVLLFVAGWIINECWTPIEYTYWSLKQFAGRQPDKRPFLVFRDPIHYFCRCIGCNEPVKCHGLCWYHRKNKLRRGYSC